ncbi:MAG: AbrB/MazE/SpoVT family DNA-binding domain-containing protein [Candidatus Hydrothermarchaeales archaeon]
MDVDVEITKMSSKGQIVIPKKIRNEFGFRPGENFVVFGSKDTIILKKVEIPSTLEAFEALVEWGVEFAKKKGIKEEDIEKIIHRHRGAKD